jgi:hypothetical protein
LKPIFIKIAAAGLSARRARILDQDDFCAKLTRRRLKNGVFCSVVDLQAAINSFIKEHNHEPKPLRLEGRS